MNGEIFVDGLILRELEIDDAPEAAAVCKKCLGKHGAPRKTYLANAACDWRKIYFVAELDGKIVACMGARVAEFFEDYYKAKKDTAKIENVAVDPDYHGLGIGTKLFTKLLAKLDDIGVNVSALKVHVANTPAIEFYERFGFYGPKNIEQFDGSIGMILMIRIKWPDNLHSEQ